MLWKVKRGGWIVLFTPLPEVSQYCHPCVLGQTVFPCEVGAKHNPPLYNIFVDMVIIHDADKGLKWLEDMPHSQLRWILKLRLRGSPTSLVHC